MAWDSIGQEGDSHGDGKANVWQHVFAGPPLTAGHREEFEQIDRARLLPVYHTEFILNYSYL